MTNRFNFRPSREPERTEQPPTPTKADALGIKPPALTPEQREGNHVEAVIASQKRAEKMSAYEVYRAEREAYEKTRDEALWRKIEARRRAAL
jgi:hypothetical protein